MGNLNVKPPESRKDVLQDFHGSASIGGLPQSFNAYYKYLRGIWVFLMIVGMVATVYHSIDVIGEYYKYPIQVTISIETRQQLPIPAVTVCNLNPVRKSKVECGSMAKLAGIQNIPSAPTLRNKEIDQMYQAYVKKKEKEINGKDEQGYDSGMYYGEHDDKPYDDPYGNTGMPGEYINRRRRENTYDEYPGGDDIFGYGTPLESIDKEFDDAFDSQEYTGPYSDYNYEAYDDSWYDEYDDDERPLCEDADYLNQVSLNPNSEGYKRCQDYIDELDNQDPDDLNYEDDIDHYPNYDDSGSETPISYPDNPDSSGGEPHYGTPGEYTENDKPVYDRKDYWLSDMLKMDTFNFYSSYKLESCSNESTEVSPYLYTKDGSGHKHYWEDSTTTWAHTDINEVYYEREADCNKFCQKMLPEQTGKVLSLLGQQLHEYDEVNGIYKQVQNVENLQSSQNLYLKNEKGEYEKIHEYFALEEPDSCTLYYDDGIMMSKYDPANVPHDTTLYVLELNQTTGIGHYAKFNGCSESYPICKHSTNCSQAWWSEENGSPFGKEIASDESYDWGMLLENTTLDDFQDVRDIFSFEPYMKDMGYQAEDLIVECTIDRKKCDPKKDFHQTFEKHYGNCYTFNRAWGDQKPNMTSRSGNSYGLRLTLDIGAADYLGLLAPEYGARISIHNPHVRPVPEEIGFVVHPGMMSEVSVWLKEIIRLPDPYKSNCLTDYPELYKQFGIPDSLYTIRQCHQACLDYYLYETCGCVQQMHLVENADSTYTQCSMFDTKQRNCTFGVFLKFEDLKCECNPECHEFLLQTSLSHSKWPSEEYERMKIGSFYGRQKLATKMLKKLNKDGETAYNDWVSKNLVRLHIYYASLSFEKITEERAYTPARLFSDLGGVLGLYLGISIVTLIECAQLVFMLIITKSKGDVEPEDKSNDDDGKDEIYNNDNTDPTPPRLV